MTISEELQAIAAQIEELIEPLHSSRLHAAYGKAMLQAHSLELSLVNLLMLSFIDQEADEQKFEERLNKIKRLTMGKLINEVIERYEISDFWQEELSNVLFSRNRLTHQISEDIISAHLEEGGRAKVISEIAEIEGFFRDAQNEIDKIVFEHLATKGIGKDNLLQAAKAFLKCPKKEIESAEANGEAGP